MKIISFYLPQYHPIPENDHAWGAGFTEWTNVAAARPRFAGHHQPQIPADLGFYDLRLEQTRLRQAELAQQYGIGGFCYYHYWFNGKRLLSLPLDEIIASGRPDFPFCLCWANENWTRAWDGLDREVIIDQKYSGDDHLKHIEWLTGIFADSRYIKINNKPLLLIYRLDNIPQVSSMVNLWKEFVSSRGFDGLYLCAVKTGFVGLADDQISQLGFDAIVDFQPNRQNFPQPVGLRPTLYKFLRDALPEQIYQSIKLKVSANNVVDYRRMVDGLTSRMWPEGYRKFPCAFPSWDNSARRKSATIIQNDDPGLFKGLIADCLKKVQRYPEGERIVFVNAWNEWAEGCHLEPDRKFGHSYLNAIKEALQECE